MAAVAGCILVLGATVWLTQRYVLGDLRLDLQRKLDVYAAYLESESRRFELMPDLLALAPDVRRLVAEPDNPDTQAAANAYLAAFAESAGASAVYVMDMDGLTRAASNHAQPGSFVGHSYAFRPYFTAAAAGGRGRYVALGATSNVPGYYVAVPVVLDGRVAGVAVVKYDDEALVPWPDDGDKIMVAGEDNVVFAANDPQLQFTRLDRLLGPAEAPIEPRRYGNRPLPLLAVHGDGLVGGLRIVALENGGSGGEFGLGSQPPEYAVGVRAIAGSNWNLVVLADAGGRMRRILLNALTAALALGLLVVLASHSAQRRRYMRSVYENAIRDPLTRLYTRLYMNDVVGRMLQAHDRGALSGVALVIFDVDHFKRVNDTHGHHVGDEVLAGVAAVILETARATDVPVRFGGEEIAVFLPAADIGVGVQFAERIRHTVEQRAFANGLRVTLSGGVAVYHAGEPVSQLVIRADSALYEAKRAGRNRIAVADCAAVPAAG